MKLFTPSPPRAKTTLRVLAHLLAYPDADLRVNLGALAQALKDQDALSASRRIELERLIQQLQRAPAMQAEEEYGELFDRGRGTSLHLFEHVHGDSRDRGPAMVDLMQTYEKAGLLMPPGELPDYLPVVLEFASTQPDDAARAFLHEMSHILQAIFSALLKRQSPYASVLAAALDLAGDKAQAVSLPDELALDEAWEEPVAFGGCSTAGQAAPGQPQPIQIVRRPGASTPSSIGART